MQKIFLLWFLFLLFQICNVQVAHAQWGTKNKKSIQWYKEADNYRVRGNKQEAIVLLEQVIKRDKKFLEAYLLLSRTYKEHDDVERAIQILSRGLPLSREHKKYLPFFLLAIGEGYLLKGNYLYAEKYLKEYLQNDSLVRMSTNQRAMQWYANAQYGLKHQQDSISIEVKPMGSVVNQYALQYFPLPTADGQSLIFTRRKTSHPQDDENIVVSKKNKYGEWTTPIAMPPPINTDNNEGSASLSADGKMLIFALCPSTTGHGHCDLYQSRLIAKQWTRPVNMGVKINSLAWDSQPSLSADGNTLYFVSDRKGGVGGRDIYVSYKGKDQQWSTAKNMGMTINSRGEDVSPFIHPHGKMLFFSSDGRTGFGGYDIYLSEKRDGTWTNPVNVGSPINDYQDQTSLTISVEGHKAYYAHEQKHHGQEFSVLMEVTLPPSMQARYGSCLLQGVVSDRVTQQPLAAQITLFNRDKQQSPLVLHADSLTGYYLAPLVPSTAYAIHVTVEGYIFRQSNFFCVYSDKNNSFVKNIEMDSIYINKPLTLEHVSFAFDSDSIDRRSSDALSGVISFLKENENIKVEIAGHTDSQGEVQYNENLSYRRAQSVALFLASKGIDRHRITWKGYGARHPIASNVTEEGRRANRRITLMITAM